MTRFVFRQYYERTLTERAISRCIGPALSLVACRRSW